MWRWVPRRMYGGARIKAVLGVEIFVFAELFRFGRVDWLRDAYVKERQPVRSMPAMPSIQVYARGIMNAEGCQNSTTNEMN